MSNKLVSIIVVEGGAKNYLLPLLDSIKQQTYSHLEIKLIDNSLDPDFNRKISKQYPAIDIYQSPKNIFYCQALNIGIRKSKGDFILCLNDDVILDQRFIEEALKGFYINDKIGMVSGKILRSDKQTLDSTGLFLSPWRSAKERGYGLKDRGQFEKEEYIFGVNGAVAFYRREMLENIKIDSDYFDRDYNMFYEDLDISWRGQSLGWKAYYAPKAIAYHVRGGTVRKSNGIGRPYARRYLSEELEVDLLKNRHLTMIKNESLLGLFLHLPFIFCYEFLVLGYILFFKPQLIKKIFLNLHFLRSALFKKRIKLC
jgi:GT2 family glycosyltransferase